MTSAALAGLVAGILALLNVHASAGSDPPPIDERGAVLCIWSITMIQLTVGETCFAERDREYLDGLRWSMGEMDAFILRNSSTTQDALNTDKAGIYDETIGNILKDSGGQCVPEQDAFMIYPKPEHKPTRAGIERHTSALLEVDRPPVMNPCL